MKDIHIGSVIKTVVNDRKTSLTELADVLGMHFGSVSRIYSSSSIQVSQLVKLSVYLKFDFFAFYSENMDVKCFPIAGQGVKKSEGDVLLEEKVVEIEGLRKEIADLKLEGMQKENGYLRQINGLLLRK